MKKLPLLLLLFLSAHLLQAQEKQPFFSRLYADVQFGLFIAEDIMIATNLEAGYRLNQRHALGLQQTGLANSSTSVNRGAQGVGPVYRYQTGKWTFSGGGGYVFHYDLEGDFIYPFEIQHHRSNPWFFRLGLQRRLGRVFCLGMSYGQSGDFTVEHTDTDTTPPERWSGKREGAMVFTINLGLFFQSREY